MDVWNIVIVVIDVLFITGALLWVRANNSRIEQRLKYLEKNIDRLFNITTEQNKVMAEFVLTLKKLVSKLNN